MADLEPAVLPGVADRAQERGDYRLEKGQRAQPRRGHEKAINEQSGVEALDEAQESRRIGVRSGQWQRRGRTGRVREEKQLQLGVGCGYDLLRAVSTGEGLGDSPEP